VVARDDLQAGGGRRVERLDQLADRAVERAAGRPLGRVDEEEAAEGEEAAQRLDLAHARHRELAVAGQVEERRLVQASAGVAQGDDPRLGRDRDRRALVDLPGDPLERGGARVPALAELEVTDPEQLGLPDGARAAGQGRRGRTGAGGREAEAEHVAAAQHGLLF
jgi:hypothetical protein